ncbi:hypothetical protein JL720_8527 [Aureococcus anophagefferens]|nr:hypothetical protein JL720_8527 [Aureococcus anophagefferens]
MVAFDPKIEAIESATLTGAGSKAEAAYFETRDAAPPPGMSRQSTMRFFNKIVDEQKKTKILLFFGIILFMVVLFALNVGGALISIKITKTTKYTDDSAMRTLEGNVVQTRQFKSSCPIDQILEMNAQEIAAKDYIEFSVIAPSGEEYEEYMTVSSVHHTFSNGFADSATVKSYDGGLFYIDNNYTVTYTQSDWCPDGCRVKRCGDDRRRMGERRSV